MEDLSKSGARPTVGAALPSIDEHEEEVRKIFRTCGFVAAAVFFFSVVAIALAIASGVSLQTLAMVAPVVMAVVITVFGVGYGIPVGLVSLRRLGLTIKMGYESRGDLRDAIKHLEPAAQILDQKSKDGAVDQFFADIHAIRAKLDRETSPLPTTTRRTTTTAP